MYIYTLYRYIPVQLAYNSNSGQVKIHGNDATPLVKTHGMSPFMSDVFTTKNNGG